MDAVTRKEKILDGQDLTPVTRKEYFLKKAVGEGGGGGGLPAYSSSDIGKVLMVVEGGETAQRIIVPEQTVTISEEQPYANLTNADADALSNISVGATASAVINGVEYVATGTERLGIVEYAVETINASFTYDEEYGGAVLVGLPPANYTVSLSDTVSSVELKWESVI